MIKKELKTTGESFLREAMELNDLPGLVIGVSRQGEEWIGAAGVRDVVTKDPMCPGDIFHCASVSKLFTSSAVMKLVDAGVLDLNDRLCDILPEMAGGDKRCEDVRCGDALPETEEGSRGWSQIRLWQMLSHTAGIGDVDDYHWEEALTGETALSDYVHSPEVMGRPLLWEPGKGGFRYSNIAYEILGHIVAVKSAEYLRRTSADAASEGTCGSPAQGLSYEAFVQRYLMEPAGMTDSTMLTCNRLAKAGLITEEIRRQNKEIAAEHSAHAGEPYPMRHDGQIKSPAQGSPAGIRRRPMALPHEKGLDRSIASVRYYPYTRAHAPSSTLTSNAADLLKWARLHMDGFAEVEAAGSGHAGSGSARTASRPDALLSFDSYQHMQYEYAEVPNNREKMGLGWFMRRQGGYRLYGHEGTDDGFRASLWICPQLDLAIVVLSNLSGAPVKKLNKKLFERLTAES